MASNPERSSGGGPLGIRLLMPKAGYNAHRAFVLILTFIAYSLYHVSRKPPSIVKSVLEADQEAALLGWSNSSLGYFSGSRYFSRVHYFSGNRQLNASADGSHFLGWAPFEGSDGTARLGEIDVAFLAAYAVGMYFSGHLGDRLPLRWFLGVGMVGSSICVGLFGAGYWFNIHWMGYFVAVQMMGGLLQATGWPAVVAVVGNWFGKGRRGLIMGIWNAHTSVGNIIGSLVASSMLRYGWGWSFLVPAATLALGGVFVVLFLVVDPTEVGLPSPYESDDSDPSDPLNDYKPLPNSKDEELGLPNKTKSKALNKPISKKLGKDVFREHPSFNHHQVQQQQRHHNPSQGSPVGFFRAWAIPGVAPFALCLFFSKLVAYTFLYWLPFYISQTEIDGKHLSDSTAGNLSTIFDIGGVIGGILAGHLSDKLNARATVSATFMFLAVPVLLLYQAFGSISLWLNILLLAICGVLVNGPYSLITTAVSADLGTHSSLKGNARALSTVTAIIDGTGSIGAALGPLITGLISSYGWDNVFYMLMGSAFISGLLLIRLVITELQEKVQRLGFSMSRLHHPLVA